MLQDSANLDGGESGASFVPLLNVGKVHKLKTPLSRVDVLSVRIQGGANYQRGNLYDK